MHVRSSVPAARRCWSCFAAWYFTGRALRPVEAIRLQAESITGSTIHRRVPEPGTDDEVGRLARTMNAMLGRLDESSQRQRQFVSDASHELRSPLASIRTNLEVALRNTDRADWTAVARARARRGRSAWRTPSSELLELARLDESRRRRRSTSLPEVDLDELVLDETLRDHRVPIDTTRVSAGRVHGRREQLARVVRNLLDNADRHAQHEVAIALQQRREPAPSSSRSTTTVPAFPSRTASACSSASPASTTVAPATPAASASASSMVKAIAEQHGGTVTIDDAPIGGARITVSLPAV